MPSAHEAWGHKRGAKLDVYARIIAHHTRKPCSFLSQISQNTPVLRTPLYSRRAEATNGERRSNINFSIRQFYNPPSPPSVPCNLVARPPSLLHQKHPQKTHVDNQTLAFSSCRLCLRKSSPVQGTTVFRTRYDRPLYGGRAETTFVQTCTTTTIAAPKRQKRRLYTLFYIYKRAKSGQLLAGKTEMMYICNRKYLRTHKLENLKTQTP